MNVYCGREYWIDINESFFNDRRVKYIRTQEKGNVYILILLEFLSMVHGQMLKNDIEMFAEKCSERYGKKTVDDAFQYFMYLGILKYSLSGKTEYIQCNLDGIKFKSRSHIESRTCQNYYLWRYKVFERDGFRCQNCGAEDVELNAHHIKSWKNYPDLRFVISNGVTWCKRCHIDYHSQYGRGND